ncbi:MAG: hypothetical protein RLY31_1442 [Bacteroidota bacterium]|jgi:hypothetical protein
MLQWLWLPSSTGQGIRRLLLFASDATDTSLVLQRQWLQGDSVGIVDRDIWIAVFTEPRTFRRMYEHHGVRNGFTLVLLGKDGTEKLRSTEPVPLQDLFGLIDSMPMRRAELQERKKTRNDRK